MPDDLPYSVPLVFTPNGNKLYAPTPAGEYAYSDAQGLYEWRRVPYAGPQAPGLPMTTMLVRIHYSGGDRQGSSNGQIWTSGPETPGRDPATWPHRLGFAEALDPRRLN
jgi:hypothetical protein